jgi:hypothetical protein
MRKLWRGCLVSILCLTFHGFTGQAWAAKAAQAKPPASPVNLNTASQAELEALPGVGPATAKKIIAGRPYTSAADLAKAGVPKNTIDKITPLVTFGVAGAAPPSTAGAAPPAPQTQAPASPGGRAPSTATTAQQPPVKGMVWVNLDTKVFHREGDRWYGKTKNGKFMTEADAISAGYHEAKTANKKQP